MYWQGSETLLKSAIQVQRLLVHVYLFVWANQPLIVLVKLTIAQRGVDVVIMRHNQQVLRGSTVETKSLDEFVSLLTVSKRW
jgi:hypothetical protein